MKFDVSKRLRERSHRVIPGGAHTYAKGDDQYPELAPGFIVRGEGCHVWDPDGNEFIEYGMGLRAVTLGHGYRPVVEAACRSLRDGVNFSRPSTLEVECAEQLTRLVPSAEMVKFAKNGSDVTTAAVKLARAHTGRDLVAICADHPFFSVDDWFIGTTEMSAGVPQAIKDLTITFPFDSTEALETLFAAHPGRIACVVMEAERTRPPSPGYLIGVSEICRRNGALLVLDEMITGFRWSNGGAQQVYGVVPDLSTFGKGLGNGHSIAALVGRRSVMEAGGLEHDRERVFLLSTTNGGETHGLAAALETMRIYEREPVIECLRRQGERLAGGVRDVVKARGL
ncbi:MAG: glutamate-1-semialdehyde 2,1-aminomutase, partial [Vicinamibacterales bacterium]